MCEGNDDAGNSALGKSRPTAADACVVHVAVGGGATALMQDEKAVPRVSRVVLRPPFRCRCYGGANRRYHARTSSGDGNGRPLPHKLNATIP